MQSSLTSDPGLTRVRRALTDPYALAAAVFVAVAALALHWPVLIAAVTAISVPAVRLGAEFLIPRGTRLEQADSLAAKQRQVQIALANAEAVVHGGAPAEVARRVADISRVIQDIVERQTRLDGASPQLFSVLRTATDYLPTAIDAYMRLPQAYATTRRVAGGRTALEVLIGQLDLLEKEMVDVADAVTRNDLDRLLAHERFLTERFGRSALSLPDPTSLRP